MIVRFVFASFLLGPGNRGPERTVCRRIGREVDGGEDKIMVVDLTGIDNAMQFA